MTLSVSAAVNPSVTASGPRFGAVFTMTPMQPWTSPARLADLDDTMFGRRSARSLIPTRNEPPHPTPPAPPSPTPPAPTPPAPTPPAPTPPAPGPDAPDLNALQQVLDQAKTTGTTEALQPLMQLVGVSTAEDLQKWVTAAHEAQRNQLSELERREADAAASKAAADAEIANAKKLALNTKILTNLLLAGAPVDKANDLIPLVTVADDADDAAITAAVEAAKAKFESLFTATVTPTPPKAPSSVPPKAPSPTPPSPTDPLAAGREKAKAAAASRIGATKEDLLNQFAPKPSPFATT